MAATQIRRWLVWTGALLVLWVLLPAAAAHAETSQADVRLTVRRVSGADLMGHVAGSFRAAVRGPENVRQVTFYLDGQAIGRATRYPFAFHFDTRDFPEGEHRLEAVAHLSDGGVTTSNSVSLEFRSYRWHLVVRQSMFLYAGVLVGLVVVAGLVVGRLLHIQPRLILLDR